MNTSNQHLPGSKVAVARGHYRVAFGAALLAVIAAVAYHNSFAVPFILDDVTAVQIDNPTIQRLWRIQDVLSPPATSGIGGRPLVNLTLAVNFAFGGFEHVWGYHLVNLVIHLCAGLALYGLVRRTLQLTLGHGHPNPASRVGYPSVRDEPATSLFSEIELLSLAIATVWLVHPLQTESVTYISQRTEALMGLCYFLTLYCFVRSARSDRPARWQIASFAACLFGVFSKEVIVTAPVMVLLFDRTFVSGTFGNAWRRHRAYYAALTGTWVVLAILMWDVSQRGIGFGYEVSSLEYAFTSCRSLVQYLRLAFWPHPLVLDYGTDTLRNTADALPYAAFVVTAVFTTLVALRFRPVAGFLGAWVLVTLAPTTSVVPVAMQPTAEHRMYLPLAAIVSAIVLGAWRGFASWDRGSSVWLRKVGVAVFALGLVCCGVVLTVLRNADYRTELSIWQDTVTKVPENGRARANLGTLLVRAGRTDEALPQFEAALRPGMKYPIETRANYGMALFQLGRFDAALRQYQLVVNATPEDAQAQFNLGATLLALGRNGEALTATRAAARCVSKDAALRNKIGRNFVTLDCSEEAIVQFREALRLVPEFAAARNNLGTALLNAGRFSEALVEFETARTLQPRDGSVRCNVGIALLELKRTTEAAAEFRKALELTPDLGPAHHKLANLLSEAGALEEAVSHYRATVRLLPGDADAHNDFGGTLAELGRFAEAEREFREALKLRPEHPSATRNLARLRDQ